MDQIYYGIYDMLYRQRSFSLPFPETDDVLPEQIDREEQEELAPHKLTLRPDARYFLFVNFQAMVRTPLLRGGRASPTRVVEDTDKDLRRIIRTAGERMAQS